MTSANAKKLREKQKTFENLMRLYSRIRHVHGPQKPGGSKNDVVVACLVRNGEEYIDAFLRHYFSLGAKHAVFMDNGSTDSTVARAKRHKNVTVLSCRTRLGRDEVVLRRYLAKDFCAGRWCLCADIDEFFDYPFSKTVKLSALTRYLSSRSYTAVVTQMLDMFSDKPLDELPSGPGRFSRKDHPCYDISGIRKIDYFSSPPAKLMRDNVAANPDIKFHMGGIRKSLFGTENWLTKHQLFFADEPDIIDAHCVNGAHLADFSAACLHYKFTRSIFARTREYVRRHFGSCLEEYKAIVRAPENPRLFLGRPAARRLNRVEDLVKSDFLAVSDAYARWAKRLETLQRDSTKRAGIRQSA